MSKNHIKNQENLQNKIFFLQNHLDFHKNIILFKLKNTISIRNFPKIPKITLRTSCDQPKGAKKQYSKFFVRGLRK